MSAALNQETLKGVLRYHPATGKFFWLRRADVDEDWNTRYAGKEAGCSWGRKDRKTRYLAIKIFGRRYTGHRLAWLYMTGEWPAGKVDHRDLDGENNRWENLRAATDAQNAANRGRNSNNTTGFKGITKTDSGKFRASIAVSRKRYHVGIFSTAEMASAARRDRAAQLLGDFARSE